MPLRLRLAALLPALWLVAFCWYSIAAVNLGKALLLGLLPLYVWGHLPARAAALRVLRLPLTGWIAAALGLQLLSLLWAVAPVDQALSAALKYSKLLLIPALMVALCDPRVHRAVQTGWLLGGGLLLVLSYLIGAGLITPLGAKQLTQVAVVASTYLDQSIMTACFAAVLWHLRSLYPSPWIRRIAVLMAGLAVLNTLLLLTGRTGYVVTLVLCTMAAAWALPRRSWRTDSALVAALAVAFLLFSGSVNQHVSKTRVNSEQYAPAHATDASSGIRLFFWQLGLDLTRERPVLGFGAGGWEHEYLARTAELRTAHPPTSRNPHEEFLQWGVEQGLLGVGVFLALLTSLYRLGSQLPCAFGRAQRSVTVALVLSCLFNSILFDAFIGEFFCIALGLLLAPLLHDPAPVHATAHVQALD